MFRSIVAALSVLFVALPVAAPAQSSTVTPAKRGAAPSRAAEAANEPPTEEW